LETDSGKDYDSHLRWILFPDGETVKLTLTILFPDYGVDEEDDTTIAMTHPDVSKMKEKQDPIACVQIFQRIGEF